jgi:Flp pilus assembly protein TadB
MAMRMRQSLAQLEQQFRHEMEIDRTRRETLRRNAAMRSRKRHRARARRRSSIRFWLLVLSLVATVVVVTVAMFESLYALLG